jgi:hypothetical protein
MKKVAIVVAILIALSACSDPLAAIKNTTTNYEINLEFSGEGFSRERKKVFVAAAQRWMSIIQDDLEDIEIFEDEIPATSQLCGFPTPAIARKLDDLLIFANITPIDGQGNILARAGPVIVRRSDELTLIGCMQFDEADVAALEKEGTFTQTILHEMGHVLGFGSAWGSLGLLDAACNQNSTTTPGFRGQKAVREYANLGKTGNPPVENNFNLGTKCSHWDEDTFDNEFMTGFLGGTTSPTINPISALTIASLGDLGYSVDLRRAEPYSIPACSPDCDTVALQASGDDKLWEIVLQPKGFVDSSGTFQLFH